MGALGLGFGVGGRRTGTPCGFTGAGGCCALRRGVLAPEGAPGGTRTPAFHGVRWGVFLGEWD